MTVDEYLIFAAQVIRSNLGNGHPHLTLARLGTLLRQSNPTTSWQAFGFPNLLKFAYELEKKGGLKVGHTEKKALAIFPSAAEAVTKETAVSVTYNPLRKPIWIAFVMAFPAGRRFLHRRDGLVRFGLEESPSPADEWAEITPVSQSEQVAWAKEFLRSKMLRAPEVGATLDVADWYVRFPAKLKLIDQQVFLEWNRQRTQLVSRVAEIWCTKNSVPTELVFQVTRRFPSATVSSEGKSLSARGLKSLAPRDLILAALHKMPTENLMEIAIPAKYLFDAIHGGQEKAKTV